MRDLILLLLFNSMKSDEANPCGRIVFQFYAATFNRSTFSIPKEIRSLEQTIAFCYGIISREMYYIRKCSFVTELLASPQIH